MFLPLISIMRMSRSKRRAGQTACGLYSPIYHLYLPTRARVGEWQTRTFEGRMPKGMRVQVPPRAPNRGCTAWSTLNVSHQHEGSALAPKDRFCDGKYGSPRNYSCF